MIFKNLFLVLIASITLTACTSEAVIENSVKIKETGTEGINNGHFITKEKAIEIVGDLLDEMEEDNQISLRSGISKRTIENIYLTSNSDVATYGSLSDDEPSVYIVNFSNNNGFALVSADDRTTPVFVITESGNITSKTEVDNPGFIMFLEGAEELYKKEISDFKASGNSTKENNNLSTYATAVKSSVAPLTKVCWHQRSPFNNNLPPVTSIETSNGKAYAGCTTIAVATFLSYYKYPLSYNNHRYDWESLTASEKIYNNGSAAATNVANLIYDICTNMNPEYKADGTGIDFNDIPGLLKKFNYSSCGSVVDYDLNKIKSSLSSGYPVLVSGYAHKTIKKKKILGITVKKTPIYSDGHVWVIDGYKPYNNGTLVSCKWGWNEDYDNGWNGYYLSETFNALYAAGRIQTYSENDNYFQYLLKIIPNAHK